MKKINRIFSLEGWGTRWRLCLRRESRNPYKWGASRILRFSHALMFLVFSVFSVIETDPKRRTHIPQQRAYLQALFLWDQCSCFHGWKIKGVAAIVSADQREYGSCAGSLVAIQVNAIDACVCAGHSVAPLWVHIIEGRHTALVLGGQRFLYGIPLVYRICINNCKTKEWWSHRDSRTEVLVYY